MNDTTHTAIMAILAEAHVKADIARGELDATRALRRGVFSGDINAALAAVRALLASSVPAAYAAGYTDVILAAVSGSAAVTR